MPKRWLMVVCVCASVLVVFYEISIQPTDSSFDLLSDADGIDLCGEGYKVQWFAVDRVYE